MPDHSFLLEARPERAECIFVDVFVVPSCANAACGSRCAALSSVLRFLVYQTPVDPPKPRQNGIPSLFFHAKENKEKKKSDSEKKNDKNQNKNAGNDERKKEEKRKEAKADAENHRDERIESTGQLTLDENESEHNIHLISIIGEIEGLRNFTMCTHKSSNPILNLFKIVKRLLYADHHAG